MTAPRMVNAAALRAMRRLAFLVSVLVGAAGPAAAAEPCVVPVPMIDDRCETWVAAYTNPDGDPDFGFDIARDVALSADGETVVIAGASSNETSDEMDVVVAAYDAATGAERWRMRHGTPAWDEPAAVAITGAAVYVTGTLWHLTGSDDVVTLALDPTTGATLWEAALDTGVVDRAADLAVSPDGATVFVTGLTEGDDQDALTAAYDAATGREVWRATYDGPHDDADNSDSDTGEGIAVDPSGDRVYVAARSRGLGERWEDYDVVTLAYGTEEGDRLWTHRYDRAGLRDGPEDIAVAPDGSRVYVGGVASLPGLSGESGFENTAVLALALDAESGERDWAGLHLGDGLNWATGIAADDDRVYLSGTASNPSQDRDREIVTVVFGADGGLEWSDEVALPGHLQEGGGGIALAGDRVYVTGSASPLLAPADLVTVAYSTGGDRAWIARHNSSDLRTSADYDPAVVADADGVYVSGTFDYGVAAANRYDIGLLAYR